MSWGVYRYREQYYRNPRARIFTMPRSATLFALPDASTLDDDGNRLCFRFVVYDSVGIRVQALAGDTIRHGGVDSSSGGYIESTDRDAALFLVAVNDSTWVPLSFTRTWTVA